MNMYFRIWGIYHNDTSESLIADSVNGGKIFTRQQAIGIIEQWEERIRDKRMFPVREWRIEKYTA